MFLEFTISVSHHKVLIALSEIVAIIENPDNGSVIELKNGNFYHVDAGYATMYTILDNLLIK